jgi:hypothetical protein
MPVDPSVPVVIETGLVPVYSLSGKVVQVRMVKDEDSPSILEFVFQTGAVSTSLPLCRFSHPDICGADAAVNPPRSSTIVTSGWFETTLSCCYR